jgi:hypothetical protein
MALACRLGSPYALAVLVLCTAVSIAYDSSPRGGCSFLSHWRPGTTTFFIDGARPLNARVRWPTHHGVNAP